MIDREPGERESPHDRIGHELVIFDQQYAHEANGSGLPLIRSGSKSAAHQSRSGGFNAD
jgi:hypothetical protein